MGFLVPQLHMVQKAHMQCTMLLKLDITLATIDVSTVSIGRRLEITKCKDIFVLMMFRSNKSCH